jgi:RHS repeat-associated protein
MVTSSSQGGYVETQNTTTVTGSSQTLAANGLNEVYSYDAFGNIQEAGNYSFIQAYTSSNQLSGWSYDAAGNVLADAMGKLYQYDAEGKIKSGAGVTYYYSPEGQRVEKSGTSPVDTVYFGGRPIARLSGGAWTDLVYGASGLLLEVPGTQTGSPTYRMTDHLGSLVGTLNAAGAVVSTEDVAPFGEIFAGGSSDSFIFTGKERDSESGNDYFGARYYANAMGRWMSPDPSMEGAVLELPQTWNKYSYVYNNPLSRTDPDGRCPICIGALVGGVVEGGYDLGKQLYNNGGHFGDVSWAEVGANTVGGAIAGGLAVATGGASLVESPVVGDLAAGATSNIVGNIATRALDPNNTDDVLSAQDISEDALSGLVGGAGGHVAADMVHIPPEPGAVKTRSGTVYRRQMAKRQAGVNARNRALYGQAARSGITSSLSTHSTNGIWDWLMFTLPPPPSEPKATVTASECDSLPDGTTRCQK